MFACMILFAHDNVKTAICLENQDSARMNQDSTADSKLPLAATHGSTCLSHWSTQKSTTHLVKRVSARIKSSAGPAPKKKLSLAETWQN